MIIYRVVSYDKATERMWGSLPIPTNALAAAKKIAGFGPQDDGLGEYPLDEEQTREIARLLEFNPELERFYYALEPY